MIPFQILLLLGMKIYEFEKDCVLITNGIVLVMTMIKTNALSEIMKHFHFHLYLICLLRMNVNVSNVMNEMLSLGEREQKKILMMIKFSDQMYFHQLNYIIDQYQKLMMIIY